MTLVRLADQIKNVGQAAAPPTTGEWRLGDRLWSTAPTAAALGWVATEARTIPKTSVNLQHDDTGTFRIRVAGGTWSADINTNITSIADITGPLVAAGDVTAASGELEQYGGDRGRWLFFTLAFGDNEGAPVAIEIDNALTGGAGVSTVTDRVVGQAGAWSAVGAGSGGGLAGSAEDYTITNPPAARRTMPDTATVTLGELAEVVATKLADDIARGIIQ